MTAQVSTKVRLVRCPRCQQVLAELPEVPLYQCGGCGTVLVAKNRKPETSRTEVSSEERVSVAKSQPDNVSEEKEARSSNDDLASPPKVETSPKKGQIRCQYEHGECSTELSENRSVSDGLSSSPEVIYPSNEDSPRSVSDDLSSSPEVTCPSIEDSPREIKESLKSDDELHSSGEFTHEAEVYTPEACEHVEQHGESHLHQDNRVDQVESGESHRVWQEGNNFVEKVLNLPEPEEEENGLSPDGEHREGTENNYVPPENEEKCQNCFGDQNGDFHGEIKHAGLDSSSAIVSHENEHTSQSAEQGTEVDDGVEGPPIFRSSRTEKNMNASVNDSIVASESPLNESLVSFYLSCPDDEHLDHTLREVTRNFGRVSSVDTLGSLPVAELSSELDLKHGAISNYPTTGSYYAYDGSESSYDGTDDQIREHISHRSRKSKDADYISTTEMLRKDGLRVNNWANSEPERNYWATSSSHRAMKSSQWNQYKSTEANRYTSGNRMRLDKRGGISRLPVISRDPVAGHRIVSPSSYRHNLPPPHPGFHSSDKPSYLEPDKMDLLRTVCELKDQLNRLHFPKVTTDRRFPVGIMEEKFTPFHYDHSAAEREIYADLNHPRGYHRHNPAKGCAERCNVSRLAFSGEAAHYRHQVGCSCSRCCPQDCNYSAQLPSYSIHCKNSQCVAHTDHNRCNTSSSLSPQHYTSSKLSLRGCETQADNQRHRDNEMQRLYKEKYHTAKRHLLPVAGGAPVIACYHCSKLLQLPADFLLFKKRYHQLMCNACRKVLKFSLLERTHVVPYLPDASAPPPSEAENYNDATNHRNLGPVSSSNSCQHVEPLSCSDDYGRSFCRSCSTEGETSVILSSFDQVERNSYNRKMSSGSFDEPIKDRKMKSIMKESPNKNESSVKTVESVGPSSKMPKWRKATSEIEELRPPSNSPLHWLMGYSSPSQVLNK